MKFFVFAFVLVASALADVSELPTNEYLPPVQEAPAPAPLPVPAPVQQFAPAPIEIAQPVPEPAPAHELANDGYRYKTVKRYRYRIRRDVNELPSNEYLPPVQAAPAPAPVFAPAPAPAPVFAPAPIEIAQPEPEPAHELANDGYRYKTVKRYRYRIRRDVNELPSNEYLPPTQAAPAPAPVFAPAPAPAPVFAPAPIEISQPEPEPAHELANDGYRYKTVKRYRYRIRRDVNELPSNEYLPPTQAAPAPAPVFAPAPAPAPVFAPAPIEISQPEPEPAHELANDGYRYKTVKRYRYRIRRDVNELPSNEYLPPTQAAPAPAPVFAPAPAPAPVFAPAPIEISQPEPEPAHELANDGYRYKTVKRYRYRIRRDVNELPSNEYLPPTQAAPAPAPVFAPAPAPAPVFAPAPIEISQPEPEPAHELANDGYRYKTVKRYRYRIRRDVNELPSNEYLPPTQAAPAPAPVFAPAPAPAPVFAPAPIEISQPEPEPAHELANDGYRYKTVKRYRYRIRRDVNELPSNEYLPPTQAAPAPAPVFAPAPAPAPVFAPAPIEISQQEPEPAHELANDGYRYKTAKRYRYRYRY